VTINPNCPDGPKGTIISSAASGFCLLSSTMGSAAPPGQAHGVNARAREIRAFLGENLLSSGNPLPMNRDSNKTGSIMGFFMGFSNGIFHGICFMFFFIGFVYGI
jgi:hypothetical protein